MLLQVTQYLIVMVLGHIVVLGVLLLPGDVLLELGEELVRPIRARRLVLFVLLQEASPWKLAGIGFAVEIYLRNWLLSAVKLMLLHLVLDL